MSNDPTPTPPARPERSEPSEAPESRLPQFDPTSTGARDETQVLPSAPTAQTPIVPPATPYAYAGGPAAPAEAAPAVAEAAPGRAGRGL